MHTIGIQICQHLSKCIQIYPKPDFERSCSEKRSVLLIPFGFSKDHQFFFFFQTFFFHQQKSATPTSTKNREEQLPGELLRSVLPHRGHRPGHLCDQRHGLSRWAGGPAGGGRGDHGAAGAGAHDVYLPQLGFKRGQIKQRSPPKKKTTS